MSFVNDIEEVVYLEYQTIDQKAYQSKIRFYESNLRAINQLPEDMNLEINLEYVIALFEVGEYYPFLRRVDPLLVKVIEDNVFSIDGDDIYQELLYRKGAALYNVLDYYKADHILSELCRIDKNSELYEKTFKKNKIDAMRSKSQKSRAIIIAMLLITGFIIGVELLIIRPFFPEWVNITEALRVSIFAAALLGMVIQELRIRYSAKRAYRKVIKA